MTLLALTGDNLNTLTFLFQYYHFKISNDFMIYFVSPVRCDLRIYIGLEDVFWAEIITSVITDMGTQRKCGQNIIIEYVHCVKSN